MYIYDPYGWIVRSLSLLILIYVGIQCLLAYSISYFLGTVVQRNITMSNIKHQKHGAFYEISYLPNNAMNYFFQNSYFDVWQDYE